MRVRGHGAAVPEQDVLVLANIGSDFRKSGCKGRKEERGRKGMREGGRRGEKRTEGGGER